MISKHLPLPKRYGPNMLKACVHKWNILSTLSCTLPHNSDCIFESLEVITDRFWEERSMQRVQMTSADFPMMRLLGNIQDSICKNRNAKMK